jgi:hypothetical protein
VVLAIFVAGLLLPAASGTLGTSEVICSQARVKPIQRICGIMIDQTGAPVARARVAIREGETELFAVETGNDGKFAFDGLNAGSYDVLVKAEYFRIFQFPIVLVQPGRRCKRALEVEVVTAGEVCSSVRLVGPKAVERRLHTSQ